MEALNHNTSWLNTITTEIDKLLIDREYINFFMKKYMQWSKDDGSTSSYQILIIPRLPRFEKLDFPQLQLYTEAQKTTQCFVCFNKKTEYSHSSCRRQRRVFIILHMLRIHTGLRKWSKRNVFDLHLKKNST